MKAIELTSNPSNFIISLDKTFFDKETLLTLLERFRIEYLAKKINFDKAILNDAQTITLESDLSNNDAYNLIVN